MPRWRFSIRFDLMSSSNEKISFFTEMIFHWYFLYERHENKYDTIVVGSSSRFETCAFWPRKVSFRIWPRVRARSGHDRSRSICIASKTAWRAESFGTICASLSPSCRKLLAKTGFWSHLISMTSPWPPIISCTWIITDGVSGHDPERIGWFRSV